MKASTKAVTVEIDDAIAALDAQLVSSASVLDQLGASLANTTSCKAIAGRLCREADAMRATADRYR